MAKMVSSGEEYFTARGHLVGLSWQATTKPSSVLSAARRMLGSLKSSLAGLGKDVDVWELCVPCLVEVLVRVRHAV